MSDLATAAPKGIGGSSNTRTRRGKRASGRIAACLILGAVVMAVFPSLASAFTAKPLFGPVSATPTSDGATLTGTVYPYGLDTHYHFEYGASATYGTSIPTPEGDLGSAEYPNTVQAQQTITGLASGTYHYRLVASNSLGTTMSTDQTFTTSGPPPTVTDEAATETSTGVFELKGSVNPNGSAATYQFEYGTSTSYGSKVPASETSVGAGSIAVSVSQTISSLLPNTEYHFRLGAGRGAGNTVTTADRTFMTPAAPPSAPTAVVSAPQAIAGGFRLKGQINPNSLETTYHFAFGTSTSYGTNIPASDVNIGAGTSAVTVMQDVTSGLLPNTTYHYKIVASNSKGPGESGDEHFTTPPLKPVVSTLPVTESAEGFTLNGTVNANGGATTYHFDFGITEEYGQSIPASEVSAGSGTEAASVSQLVKGLPPGVPYHYRVVAKNAGGTTTGADEFFMTPSETETPPPGTGTTPPPTLTPPPLAPSPTLTVRPATATASGGAVVRLAVSSAGEVKASGKQLKVVSSSANAAGTVTLNLKLTGAGMKALKKAKGHKLSVKVTFVFQPAGGAPVTSTKTVVFRLKSG